MACYKDGRHHQMEVDDHIKVKFNIKLNIEGFSFMKWLIV